MILSRKYHHISLFLSKSFTAIKIAMFWMHRDIQSVRASKNSGHKNTNMKFNGKLPF